MARKQKIAIIDAHALIHRAYHALPPMSAPDGTPTNAVYGFTTMMLKMFTVLKSSHVVAAFDVKGPTFRHKEFKAYKAHRKKADDELVVQFDLVRELVRAFNIPVISKEGYEADDVIGTLVKNINGDVKKVIVTGDKDTLQLIDDNTSVFTLRRGMSDTVLFDEALVQQQYGFASDLIPDYKGLCGDPSDNIPGVKGIGEKTAKDLVGKYGSIENVYKNFEELSTRAKTRLEGNEKEALFSRKLATIKCDVPIEFKLEEAELSDFDPMEVQKIFAKFGFKNLMSRIPNSSTKESQPTLFKKLEPGSASASAVIKLPENYHLVSTEDEKKKLKERLKKEKVIAFDTETDSLDARKFPIVGMSMAVQEGKGTRAWYVPVTPETVKEWKEILEDENIGKVGQNLKYDYEVVAQSDIELKPIVFDTKIASYLLNPGSRQHSLDSLALEELGHHNIPTTDLMGKGKNQILMSAVPLEQMVPYACEDADIAWQLYKIFEERIDKAGLTQVLEELELPLITVLAGIEMAGVKIDKEALKKLQGIVEKKLDALRKNIWKAAGEEFNINSTQQLRVVLYEKLKLPTEGISKTQSGYSTAAAELDKLEGKHEIISFLGNYRELSKLLSTYIKTLPEMADEKTGRVYAWFNQAVTATGRLSSSDPNLQNIPIRTDLGKEIRAAFVAERGHVLIKADYAQVELRIVAHLSQDEKMIDAFRAGEDIHSSTAAWVHGVGVDQVTSKMRRAAKSLNFGVLYGMGPNRFAQEADVSREEARSFIERYKEQYAGVTKFIEETIRRTQEQGYIETLMGRRRHLPEINSRNPSIRAAAERAAYNFPVQGTAADILKVAMVNLSQRIQKYFKDTQIVLTVHDELVCEVPEKQADKFTRAIKEVMEGAYELDVPMTVDVEIGSNWRDMKLVDE
jgi:DNA polymerase I